MSIPQHYNSNDIYYFNAHRPRQLVLRLKQRYDLFSQHKDTSITQIFAKHGFIVKHISTNSDNFGTGHVIFFVTTSDNHEYVFRANIGLDEPEHYMALEEKFIDLAHKAHFPTGTIIAADISRS
jgi:hypothetical protein